jgi:hypothetical protein
VTPRRRGRRRIRGARQGIVLFAAVALLALLGLLIAGAMASMTLASRSATLVESNARLDGAAELAAESVIAEQVRFALPDLPYGVARAFDIPMPNEPRVAATATVTRLRAGLLWIVGEARGVGGDRGVRRVNIVARIPSVMPMPIAPLVARGSIVVGPAASFDVDSTGDPDCAALSPAPNSAQAHDSSAFLLAAAQRAPLEGAPSVLHLTHDTTLGPGSFAGLIIADGSLTIRGPFTMSGLIAARGWIDAPSGLVLIGAALSFDSSAHAAITVDASSVRYSPCAVARELRRVLPARRIGMRSWSELF